jgi:RNA polymerase sigma-70 factor (ECF subfamily)
MLSRTSSVIVIDQPVDRIDAAPACEATYDLASIYDAWFRSVFRWVLALGGPQADAEDLTQEVFLVVQRKLPMFDGKNLPGWLYRITDLTVSDYRRRAWFRKLFLRPRGVVLEDFAGRGASSEELLQGRQERERFYALVRRMNAKWRDSFVLFEVLGYRIEEIAILRATPSATVRTHLHRARTEFLKLVAKERS